MGLKLTDPDIKNILSKHDEDNSKGIGFDEFKKMMEETHVDIPKSPYAGEE
jgi:Ca2+-binding EF-hand superfamily protein